MYANIELLASVTEADWQRAGDLEGVGRFTLEDWLRLAAGHCFEHISQLESYVGVKS